MWPLITHFHTCHINSCWYSISIAHSPMPCRSARSGRQGDSIWKLVTSLYVSKAVIKDFVKYHYFRNQFWKYPVRISRKGTIFATIETDRRNRRNRPTSPSQPSQPTDASFATNHATFATVATDPRNHRNRVSDNFQIID
jgi:hypothetical protein